MEASLSVLDGLGLFDTVYMPARNLADKTRGEYRRDILQLIQFLKHKKIGDRTQVCLHELDAYMFMLDRQQLQPNTRSRKAYAIKTFFAHLEEHGHIDGNPSDELVPQKIPTKEPRFLTEEEYNVLLA